MLRKIPNYEYRDNHKNTSDSSSGCEDDFDADDSYVNDGDETEPHQMDSTAATALNLSPMPHFPPPPDYPPPANARIQTPQRSRYYYYEQNGKTEMNGSRLRVGSLDRDCGYTTDGNEICSQYNNQRHNGSNTTSNGTHSANNSFSSTSSSSNSSVVMHKVKQPQPQMRYPPTNSTNDFDSIEIFTTEQEKRFPHKTLASLSKTSKTKMQHYADAGSVRSGNSSQNINVVELFEQNLIPFGGSAASFAREAKLHSNVEPQVSFINFWKMSA